jgi:uncharacterized protein (TIGR03067 family)
MAKLRTGHVLRCLLMALAVGCLASCAEEDDDGGGGDGGGDGGGGSDPALVATWSGHEVGDTVTVWTFVFGETEGSAATDGAEVYSGEYTVDTTADPNELTMVIASSSFEAYVGETTNAIYEIVGDQLTFAGNEPGNPARPTSFAPGAGARVFELTRQ